MLTTPRPSKILIPAILAVIAVVAGGCSLLGGSNNPRPDLPGVTRPSVLAGAVGWPGLDWQAVTFEQPPKTSTEQWDQATEVVAGPGGWVAVGSNGNVMGYQGRIWQSADSLDWKLVASASLVGLELVDVAATAGAYVAIGTNSTDVNDATTSILHSTDGQRWVKVNTVPEAWAARVAAGPLGFAMIVQVGETTELLLSADGRTWLPVAGRDIGTDVWLADVAWDGNGWIAVGSAGERAVVLRSPDGTVWTEEPLPASGPVDGVIDVSAYTVIPGRWATLVLGIDRGPSCAADDDWCDKYQAAWSWTAESGWIRLPRATWILGRGYGVDVVAAGEAGFLFYLGDDVRTSADGWDWTSVKQSSTPDALATAAVVTTDRLVAVGSLDGDDALSGWFGSALVRR